MRLLLDTCSLIWALQDPDRLSPKARNAMLNPKNSMTVSTVSIWEMALKSSIGKLRIEGFEISDLPEHITNEGWEILPLEAQTAASSYKLPYLGTHRDPFDRMLIWIALQHNYYLISRDGIMGDYEQLGLKLCW